MRTVMTQGTGVRAAFPGYDLAGKTGTTSDFRDAWFDGFTGGVTTVVWVGRDDNAPMRGITGGSAPAELWKSYMRIVVRRSNVTAIPPGPPAPATPPPPPPGALPPPLLAPSPSNSAEPSAQGGPTY
jgi:penicillin-binding protein 1A